MSLSQDDSRMRELLQRVKDADQQHAPAFENVLHKPAAVHERKRPWRLQVAVAGCAALILIVTFASRSGRKAIFNPSPAHMVENDDSNQIDSENRSSQPLEIDFDELHRAIEEYYATSGDEQDNDLTVWSSNSESLLAMNVELEFHPE